MGRVIKLILYYFAYNFGIGILFMAGYAIALQTTDLASFSSDPGYISMTMLAQVLGTLAVCCHLLCWKYVKRDQLTLHFPKANKVMLASVILIVGMGFWTNYLTELTELPDVLKETFRKAMNDPFGIISVVIMAPLMEELLFRGAIQGYLMRKWKNPAIAIVVASLIFGVIHGNPIQIFFAFLTGLALGWIYYRTGSLLPAMLMHFINNGASVVLFHLSGGTDETMTEALGNTGSVCLALAGAVLTVVSIWYIKNRLLPTPIVWREEPVQTEEIKSTDNI